MSTTYTSTIEVNVWKEHTCLHCGTVYRYLFKRTKQGQGATPDAASAAAHNAVVSALANEVDMQPCAGCGSYQPDMIASLRSRRHWWAFWIGLPFFAAWIVLMLMDLLPPSVAAYLLAGTATLLGVWHLLLDAVNPNADLDANQRLAEYREEAGDLWRPRGRKGQGTGQAVGSGIGSGHVVAYVLLVGGMLAFLAPSLLGLVLGWTANSGWRPEVVGPGDTSYIYFDKRIQAVKGFWSGYKKPERNGQIERVVRGIPPRAAILNWAELGLAGPPPVVALKTNDAGWADTILIGGKESKTSSVLPHCYATFPADPALAGKKLRLRIDMNVCYPKLDTSDKYMVVVEPCSWEGTVALAGPGAGKAYQATWWTFVGLGLALSLAAGIVLPLASSAFRKNALPTDIFVPDEDGPRDEDDRADDRRDREDDGPRDRYRSQDDERGDDYRRRS